jgi:DNA polymerase-3 subunit delta
VILVTGTEGLLGDRAVEGVRRLAREKDGGVEVSVVDAAAYESGQLAALASPSLFGEARLVQVGGAESCSDAFITDGLAYLDDVQHDVTLVVRHAGGQRGKRLLDAIKALPEAVVVDCPPLKKDSEKVDFVTGEFALAHRKISAGAVRALVGAVGSDLRELASSCAQMLADTEGTVSEDEVERYYSGRVEATGFRVADAVAAGAREQALGLLRQAVASGVDPVPIVAVIALKLRTMAKVAGARGRGVDIARDLGLPPWQVDRARKELQGWTPDGISVAMCALAAADEAVKGSGRDHVYAVERAVVTITGARA